MYLVSFALEIIAKIISSCGRWVGSNAYFLPRAIYNDDTLIGFACHRFDTETQSLMLGHL